MTHPLKKDGPYQMVSVGPVAHLCNEAVAEPISSTEAALMKMAAAQKLAELFDILRIDHVNDHNTRETPQRVAKMLVEETMAGRFQAPPRITEFDNVGNYQQMIVTGPIELRSTCAHHMMPIYGSAIIGVLPAKGGKIIGLSKYDRIVHYFSARLQIQEELVRQIGDFIIEQTQPRGLAVRISAVHMCKTHRGVKASHAARMVNSEYYGDMLTDKSARAEFLQECQSLDRGGC
ncbi:MAG: GTP cyclohydrolase I [Hyphomicrobiaceae bacterium]